MGVVRGDRVAESRKLNTCSIEAQDFYGALVARCPDDFGRFRLTALEVAHALYPRRRPTMRMFQRVQRLLDELTDARLWLTWECDGVTFAELTNWQARGNHYHRTPEPPSSKHAHNGACIHTAVYQAKQWTPDRVAALRADMRRLETKRGADTSQNEGSEEGTYASEGRAEPPSSSSPSPPRERSPDRGRATVVCGDDGLGPGYVGHVLGLYTRLPDTRASPTRADRTEALRLYRAGVPLQAVEGGLLQATARRELRTRDEPLEPVGSLRYYRDAIDEARTLPADAAADLVAHLRAKIEPRFKPP